MKIIYLYINAMAQTTTEQAQSASPISSFELSKVFDFQDKKFRIAGTIDKPWFCGKDVAIILGYAKPTKALSDHIKNSASKKTMKELMDDRVPKIDTPLEYNEANLIYINEAGLYALIFKSKLEGAVKFQEYVFETILPSIRKNGYYVDPNATPEEITKLRAELDAKDKIIEENKRALANSEKKNVKLNEFVKIAQELQMNEGFYIATTTLYAKNNRFKYGGVASMKELPGRLNTYNTGRAEGDTYYFAKIYKCHNYRNIESTIATLAKFFKDKTDGRKEMIYMRYDCLVQLVEFIIDNHTRDIDYINENSRHFLEATINLDAIVPDPLVLDEYVKKNKRSDESTDVSQWNDEQHIIELKKLLNNYAENKLETPYDFDSDKNTIKLEIKWMEFSESLKIYKGKPKKTWRDLFKQMTDSTKSVVRWIVRK